MYFTNEFFSAVCPVFAVHPVVLLRSV